MPGIVPLVALISLDVTRGLVGAGYGLGFDGTRYVAGAAPIAITAATNATPIVITTAQPHGVRSRTNTDGSPIAGTAHGMVAGVLGNTAANNVDAEGYAHAVVATVVDDTRLALHAVDRTTGLIAPLAGNGAYAGGGTFTPALTDLGILLGREHLFEQSAPPRMVCVPIGSKWDSKSVSHGAPQFTGEVRSQNQRRSVRTEQVVLEFHTWGQANPPDPALDFDATQVLYHQLALSIQLLLAGRHEFLGDGAWADQLPNATQNIRAGHEHVFRVGIGTPILDTLLPYAPSDIAALPTTHFQPLGSITTSQGCSG